MPRRALGVLAEGGGLPQSVCTFSVAFDSGPNAWLCYCCGDGWECSLARLAGGSHGGCWASARSFPSAGKLSFLSRLEGVCPNSNSQLSRSCCCLPSALKNAAYWNFWPNGSKKGNGTEPNFYLAQERHKHCSAGP